MIVVQLIQGVCCDDNRTITFETTIEKLTVHMHTPSPLKGKSGSAAINQSNQAINRLINQ